MGYEAALQKAWEGLPDLKPQEKLKVNFLGDVYEVDPGQEKVFSTSCGALAKDFTAILILHYLIKKLSGLPVLSGEWQDFRELSGIEGYADAFRKRVIEPVIRKYGNNPQGLLSNAGRIPARQVKYGDAGIIIDALEGVPALITLWRADEEFGAEANILFDKSIKDIFCIEDIVVLAGIIAARV